MGTSIFMESLYVFTWHRISPSFHILIWVLLAWFVSVGFLDSDKRSNLTWRDLFGPPLIMPEEGLLIILVGVWGLNFIFSLFNTIDLNGIYTTGTDLGCMFLGYLLVRGIIFNVTDEDIHKFLFAIILINSIAAILYILSQGLHLPIYQGEQYQTVDFMDATITRTFWWMPRFYFLSLTYVISRSKWNLISIALLIVTITSAFFSYSRNTFIIYGIIILISLIISSFKGKILGSSLRLVGLMVTGIALFWFISLFFPSELAYLTERFQEINASQTIAGVTNFAIRFDDFNETFAILQKNNQLLTGLGMATVATNPAVLLFNQWTADITWVGVLFRYGMMGVILFVLLFIFSGVRTLREYFRSEVLENEEYWLMFFLLIVATFAESFISWTIFDYRNITLSLWFFVFIIVYAKRNKVPRVNIMPSSS
jgi:hypothetical protein